MLRFQLSVMVTPNTKLKQQLIRSEVILQSFKYFLNLTVIETVALTVSMDNQSNWGIKMPPVNHIFGDKTFL